MNQRKLRLYGIAAGALAITAVAVHPVTGWIVRQQAVASVYGLLPVSQLEAMSKQSEARQNAAAMAKPDDFPIQLALAIREGRAAATTQNSNPDGLLADRSQITARLHLLEGKFPNEPSLYAAILRNLSSSINLSNRDDAAILDSGVKHNVNARPVNASDLAEYETAAEIGERLDPSNSFFPMERATGLFAADRDSEACAEMVRAASASRFEDYVRDETLGNWELLTVADGETGTMSRVVVSANQTFPHYAPLRAAARATVANAIKAELAGDRQGGFALRSALMRCGSRMRTDASWLIGDLVGQSIAKTGEVRPGGEAAAPKDDDNARRTRLIESRYMEYLNSIGHPEEVAWVTHTAESSREIKDITDHGLETNALSLHSLISLLAAWATSVLALENLLWVIIVGGVAAVFCRSRAVRNETGVSPTVTAAIFVLVTGAFFGIVYATGGVLGECAFAGNHAASNDDNAMLWPRLLVAVLSTAIATSIVLFFAVRSRIKRIPISVGVTRGFAAVALPVISVLAVGYPVAVAFTGVREASTRKLLIENARHEGRFDAAAVGKDWPSYAPVRLASP